MHTPAFLDLYFLAHLSLKKMHANFQYIFYEKLSGTTKVVVHLKLAVILEFI